MVFLYHIDIEHFLTVLIEKDSCISSEDGWM